MGKKKHTNNTSSNQNQKMLLWVMGVSLVLLAVFIGYEVSAPKSSEPSGTVANIQDGVQTIKLAVSSAGYSPNEIVVKEGIPVKIITNSTEDAGCVRGLMIPDFNINEPLDVGEDSLEFTPNKKGSFEFTCQMFMSKGTLEVV